MESHLRVSEERAGEIGPEAPLLGVPADERFRVDGSAAYIDEFRIDGLIWEAAKDRDQPPPLEFGVSLAGAKDHIEFTVRTRFQIEAVIGKDVQPLHPRFSGLQLAKI